MIEAFIFLGAVRFDRGQSFFKNVERASIPIKVKIIKNLLKVIALLLEFFSKSILHFINLFLIDIKSE